MTERRKPTNMQTLVSCSSVSISVTSLLLLLCSSSDAEGAVPLQLQALHLRLPTSPGGSQREGEGEGEKPPAPPRPLLLFPPPEIISGGKLITLFSYRSANNSELPVGLLIVFLPGVFIIPSMSGLFLPDASSHSPRCWRGR